MQELSTVQQIAIAILPVILAITVHEAAHGFVADKLGDKTARLAGRVTLNPFKHIDPIGTVVLPLGMYVLTGFMFGWAKPVPVNWRNLRKPKRDSAIVAAAGPFSNFVMLLAWSLLLAFMPLIGEMSQWAAVPLFHMATFGILINAILMVLNLLPLLPLDGGRIVSSFLPAKIAYQYNKTESWGFVILLVLLFTGLLGKILTPAIHFFGGMGTSLAGLLW
jgi:Zn-dependent protease